MKKNILLIIISGLMFTSIGVVVGATLINSNQVSYKDTTVDLALDDLFDDSLTGKNKIAEAITNKGIETLSTDSYDTMVANIENISTGNPYLRYNEETEYIQALDVDDNWIDIYKTVLPIGWDGTVYESGAINPYCGLPTDTKSVKISGAGYYGGAMISAYCAGNNGVSAGSSYYKMKNPIYVLPSHSSLKFTYTISRSITTSGKNPYAQILLLDATNKAVVYTGKLYASGTSNLNVSSITGNYYIAWLVASDGYDPGDQAELKITKIWFE